MRTLGVLGKPEDDAGGEEQFGPAAAGGERFSIFHLREARGLEDHPFAIHEGGSLQVGDQAGLGADHLLRASAERDQRAAAQKSSSPSFRGQASGEGMPRLFYRLSRSMRSRSCPHDRESGRHGNQAAIPQAIEGQAVAAAHAGFFEDVLQVDLDGSGPDAQFRGDFLVLEALFHQLQNLLLPRGQLAARIAVGAAWNRGTRSPPSSFAPPPPCAGRRPPPGPPPISEEFPARRPAGSAAPRLR